MHIPLIVLGLTKSTVNLVNALLQQQVFTADEVEFFGNYMTFLNHQDQPRLALSHPNTNTLLNYSTGFVTDIREQNLWTGKLGRYGHKSTREVTKIEPEHNLLHAIGYGDTNMRTPSVLCKFNTYLTFAISNALQRFKFTPKITCQSGISKTYLTVLITMVFIEVQK